MSREEDLKLAKAILKTLQQNPDATIQELAAEHDVATDLVTRILDSHSVSEDGTIAHKGEGRGGGWVPQQETPETPS